MLGMRRNGILGIILGIVSAFISRDRRGFSGRRGRRVHDRYDDRYDDRYGDGYADGVDDYEDGYDDYEDGFRDSGAMGGMSDLGGRLGEGTDVLGDVVHSVGGGRSIMGLVRSVMRMFR